MKSLKKAHAPSKNKRGAFRGDWHVNHSSLGMGDYYGTGIKAKLGKMRDGMGMIALSKKEMNTPPRTLA